MSVTSTYAFNELRQKKLLVDSVNLKSLSHFGIFNVKRKYFFNCLTSRLNQDMEHTFSFL